VRWLGLSYSLPSGSSSSPRVAVWRRLRQLGAVSPTGSLYLLPESAEHREAFDWLIQEIKEAGGEALLLAIDQLDAEEQVKDLSRRARGEEYGKLAAEIEQVVRSGERAELRDQLEKLRRRLAEVARLDFFHAAEGAQARAALARLEATLSHADKPAPDVPRVELDRYRGRRWVTRPRPHVDRLASAWLIRRFIDPNAAIRYSETPKKGEVSFDMRDAAFGHRGTLCTFESLIASFGLEGDPALAALAGIVHAIDLADGTSARPEVPVVDSVLRAWAEAGWSDQELERHGVGLFEGLYRSLGQGAPEAAGGRKKARATKNSPLVRRGEDAK
jgi:hypothetical protein